MYKTFFKKATKNHFSYNFTLPNTYNKKQYIYDNRLMVSIQTVKHTCVMLKTFNNALVENWMC